MVKYKKSQCRGVKRQEALSLGKEENLNKQSRKAQGNYRHHLKL
jgi:hypothetical protein